jgi:hypothetical protein
MRENRRRFRFKQDQQVKEEPKEPKRIYVKREVVEKVEQQGDVDVESIEEEIAYSELDDSSDEEEEEMEDLREEEEADPI